MVGVLNPIYLLIFLYCLSLVMFLCDNPLRVEMTYFILGSSSDLNSLNKQFSSVVPWSKYVTIIVGEAIVLDD